MPISYTWNPRYIVSLNIVMSTVSYELKLKLYLHERNMVIYYNLDNLVVNFIYTLDINIVSADTQW